MMRRRTFLVCLATFILFGLLSTPAFAASLPIFSDFDGDHKLDQAELSSTGVHKNIRVLLGDFTGHLLDFDSFDLGPGRLISNDVDSDGDADLIWISQSFPRTYVTWLGDGRGNFSRSEGGVRNLLRSDLGADEQPFVDEDSDDSDEPFETQQSFSDIPLPVSNFSIGAIERFNIVSQSSSIASPFLSVIRKRGPPYNHSL